MRVLELADKLRDRGLRVVEVGGWQTRGRPFPRRPDICIRHWTAGATSGAKPSLRIVTHGRTGLPGPLCQVFQSREPDGEDICYVVASGIANHAGRGEWGGVSGNSRSMGLEIEWSGPNEHFPARRKEISELAMAAMMSCALGTNTDDACEHREYAKPAGRKIDTNLDGDELRRRMAVLLAEPAPNGAPAVARAVSAASARSTRHVVVTGDTLHAIAEGAGLSLRELLDLNPQLLQPGDVLHLS